MVFQTSLKINPVVNWPTAMISPLRGIFRMHHFHWIVIELELELSLLTN